MDQERSIIPPQKIGADRTRLRHLFELIEKLGGAALIESDKQDVISTIRQHFQDRGSVVEFE